MNDYIVTSVPHHGLGAYHVDPDCDRIGRNTVEMGEPPEDSPPCPMCVDTDGWRLDDKKRYGKKPKDFIEESGVDPEEVDILD